MIPSPEKNHPRKRLNRLILSLLLIFFGHSAAKTEYTLSPSIDISLSVTALLVTGGGTYLYNQMEIPNEQDKVNRENLLPWDRKFAGRYSSTADLMSDVGSLLAVAPFAIGGSAWYSGHSSREEFLTFSVMFIQSVLFQHGINLAFRSLELWPRPYTFATEGEGAVKAKTAKAEAYGSFFSGHASAAFTVAVFTTEWFDQTYGNPGATRVVRALAFSTAAFESVLRVAAGKHYPTDILVGALIGTGVSYGILEMHKKGCNSYSLWVAPGAVGISYRI